MAEKTLFLILLGMVLTFCLKHYPRLLFAAAPVFIVIDYLIYYRPDRVEFDNAHIFIKRKTVYEQVALNDIYEIKMTGLGIGVKTIWKIRYADHRGNGVAWFYPRYFSQGLKEFVDAVAVKNPNAKLDRRK